MTNEQTGSAPGAEAAAHLDAGAAPELPKVFEPHATEAKWMKRWREAGYFKAEAARSNRLSEKGGDANANGSTGGDKPIFSMVIPPPNVTSKLHMGHALGRTLEDAVTRLKRMQGYEPLWVPGTDHAGIATQTVVEKHLMRTEGKRRHDYSREEFMARIWEWREENGATIMAQMERLGCSYDLTREAFTMDEDRSRAVMRIFKKLHDDGLIYRGLYLVNWDPVTQTALADDEVEYAEEEGHLWHLKYPIEGEEDRFAIVATTRPETMLGDTAVAVNPKDERYQNLIGKHCILPLMNRRIPIIADDFVDREFGSGMVKITPAHDPNDYDAGQRAGLEMINILTPDAKINENGGQYEGLDRYEAREKVIADLDALGLLLRTEKHAHRVGKSYRSGAVIEPYLSKQWFVKIRPLADIAEKAVRDEEVKLIPKSWENTYFHWMENVRDWCISRQLVWGHRIPVFYDKNDPERMICTEGEPPHELGMGEPGDWEQDPDVLDTWFSSWLWPFSTLGWPDEDTEDLKAFYPTTLLLTGFDILFFWVARMIMAGYYAMEQRPFHHVLLTGLVYGKSYFREKAEGGVTYIVGEERDKYERGDAEVPKDVKTKWEKMSKSKGNGMDPNDLIDEIGTDAIRYTLCALTSQGRRQIDLERNRIIGYRNFINKLWNAARFALMNLEGMKAESLKPLNNILNGEADELADFPLEDRWILSRLATTAETMHEAMAGYHFDRASSAIYHFIWDEFCDWYLEIIKPRMNDKSAEGAASREQAQAILAAVLENICRLLHPLCPFVTEEIWQTVRATAGEGAAENYAPFAAEACCIADWPGGALNGADTPAHEMVALAPWIGACKSERVERGFDAVREVVTGIRNIRGEMNVPPSMNVAAIITSDDAEVARKLENHADLIRATIRISDLTITAGEGAAGSDEGAMMATAVAGPYRIAVPLPAEMREAEKQRLTKEREKLEAEIVKLEKKLSNEAFVAKAPEAVVQKERDRLEQAKTEIGVLAEKLVSLNT